MKKDSAMVTFGRSRTCLRHVVLAALYILFSVLSRDGYAQGARMEVIPFESTTLTDQEFLAGRDDGKRVTLAGELRLPRAGNERFPLIILLHGSGGVGGYLLDWEEELLAMGVATFVIDSFTSRGITSMNNDLAQLGRLAQTEDAYRALGLLAKHPRIDPARVMLIGFSQGGTNTLYASLVRFQRMHAAASEAHFSAYVALYPDRSFTYHEDENIAGPVRVFHGTSDNYNPIAPCRSYIERLKARGKDAQLIEYSGAAHVFDGRSFKKPVVMPRAQTMRNCRWEEAAGGQLFNTQTRQTFSYDDPCIERGATIAYDEKAATEVRKAVAEFVSATLKPARSP